MREFHIGVLANTRLTTLQVWEIDFGTLAEKRSGIATHRVEWDRRYQVKHGIKTGPAEGLSKAEDDKLVSRIVSLGMSYMPEWRLYE